MPVNHRVQTSPSDKASTTASSSSLPTTVHIAVHDIAGEDYEDTLTWTLTPPPPPRTSRAAVVGTSHSSMNHPSSAPSEEERDRVNFFGMESTGGTGVLPNHDVVASDEGGNGVNTEVRGWEHGDTDVAHGEPSPRLRVARSYRSIRRSLYATVRHLTAAPGVCAAHSIRRRRQREAVRRREQPPTRDVRENGGAGDGGEPRFDIDDDDEETGIVPFPYSPGNRTYRCGGGRKGEVCSCTALLYPRPRCPPPPPPLVPNPPLSSSPHPTLSVAGDSVMLAMHQRFLHACRDQLVFALQLARVDSALLTCIGEDRFQSLLGRSGGQAVVANLCGTIYFDHVRENPTSSSLSTGDHSSEAGEWAEGGIPLEWSAKTLLSFKDHNRLLFLLENVTEVSGIASLYSSARSLSSLYVMWSTAMACQAPHTPSGASTSGGAGGGRMGAMGMNRTSEDTNTTFSPPRPSFADNRREMAGDGGAAASSSSSSSSVSLTPTVKDVRQVIRAQAMVRKKAYDTNKRGPGCSTDAGQSGGGQIVTGTNAGSCMNLPAELWAMGAGLDLSDLAILFRLTRERRGLLSTFLEVAQAMLKRLEAEVTIARRFTAASSSSTPTQATHHREEGKSQHGLSVHHNKDGEDSQEAESWMHTTTPYIDALELQQLGVSVLVWQMLLDVDALQRERMLAQTTLTPSPPTLNCGEVDSTERLAEEGQDVSLPKENHHHLANSPPARGQGVSPTSPPHIESPRVYSGSAPNNTLAEMLSAAAAASMETPIPAVDDVDEELLCVVVSDLLALRHPGTQSLTARMTGKTYSGARPFAPVDPCPTSPPTPPVSSTSGSSRTTTDSRLPLHGNAHDHTRCGATSEASSSREGVGGRMRESQRGTPTPRKKTATLAASTSAIEDVEEEGLESREAEDAELPSLRCLETLLPLRQAVLHFVIFQTRYAFLSLLRHTDLTVNGGQSLRLIVMWLLQEAPLSPASLLHFGEIAAFRQGVALEVLRKSGRLAAHDAAAIGQVAEVLLPLLLQATTPEFLTAVTNEVLTRLEGRLQPPAQPFSSDELDRLAQLGTAIFTLGGIGDADVSLVAPQLSFESFGSRLEEIEVMDGSPVALLKAMYNWVRHTVTDDVRVFFQGNKTVVQKAERILGNAVGKATASVSMKPPKEDPPSAHTIRMPNASRRPNERDQPHSDDEDAQNVTVSSSSSSSSSATGNTAGEERTGTSGKGTSLERESTDSGEENSRSSTAQLEGLPSTAPPSTPSGPRWAVPHSVRQRFLIFLENLIQSYVSANRPISSTPLLSFVHCHVPVPNIQDEYRRKLYFLVNVTDESSGSRSSTDSDGGGAIPDELRLLVSSLPHTLSPYASVAILRDVLSKSAGGNPRYTYVCRAALDLQLPISTTRSRVATAMNMWSFLRTQSDKLPYGEWLLMQKRCLINFPLSYILSSYWLVISWSGVLLLVAMHFFGMDYESSVLANSCSDAFGLPEELVVPLSHEDEAEVQSAMRSAKSLAPTRRTMRSEWTTLLRKAKPQQETPTMRAGQEITAGDREDHNDCNGAGSAASSSAAAAASPSSSSAAVEPLMSSVWDKKMSEAESNLDDNDEAATDGFFLSPAGGNGSTAAAVAAYALRPAMARIPILSSLRGSDRGDLKTTLFILDAPPVTWGRHPHGGGESMEQNRHLSADSFPRAMYLVQRISAALHFPFFVDMEKPLTMELLEARVAERMRRVSSNHTWFWLRPVVRFFPLGLRKTEVSLIENTCVRAERQDNRVTFIVYIHDQVPVTVAFLEKLKSRSSLSRSANIVVLAHQESLQRGGVRQEELDQFQEIIAYDVHHLPWAGYSASSTRNNDTSILSSSPWYQKCAAMLLAPQHYLPTQFFSLETWNRYWVAMDTRLHLSDAIHAFARLRRS